MSEYLFLKYNIYMEQTLILIKPDAIEKKLTGLILSRFEALGLEIVAAKVTVTNRALWQEHYANLKGTDFVDSVIDFMMGKYNHLPDHRMYAFVLRGEQAITKVRAALGATNPDKAEPWTLRGQFGQVKDGAMPNAVHASGSAEDAAREIALWFKPEEILP